MNKTLLASIFALAFGLTSSIAVFANDNLADFHSEMGGCEVCHENGESPSADGQFELQQCESCHGGMDEMSDVHQQHKGVMECSDCHQVHEMKMGDKVTCETCHDDK